MLQLHSCISPWHYLFSKQGFSFANVFTVPVVTIESSVVVVTVTTPCLKTSPRGRGAGRLRRQHTAEVARRLNELGTDRLLICETSIRAHKKANQRCSQPNENY